MAVAHTYLVDLPRIAVRADDGEAHERADIDVDGPGTRTDDRDFQSSPLDSSKRRK
jgi:hypothetical protein